MRAKETDQMAELLFYRYLITSMIFVIDKNYQFETEDQFKEDLSKIRKNISYFL